jgi:phage terminase large subunit-like protein
MWTLREAGLEGGDPSFHFVEFAAGAGCELDDEAAWKQANPALDDFLHRDAMRALLPPKKREATFRRARSGQWVDMLDEPWLPPGTWDACEAPVGLSDGAEVVLGFDGSFNGDCTALVAVSVNGTLTHSGDARLSRHIGNCVVRVDTRGTRLAKEHKHSLRRIDLAVAAVMAHSRATWLAGRSGVQLFTFSDDD